MRIYNIGLQSLLVESDEEESRRSVCTTGTERSSPDQEADGSAMGADSLGGRLKDLCQKLKSLHRKPTEDTQGEG